MARDAWLLRRAAKKKQTTGRGNKPVKKLGKMHLESGGPGVVENWGLRGENKGLEKPRAPLDKKKCAK